MSQPRSSGQRKWLARIDLVIEICSLLARLLLDHSVHPKRLAHTDSLADRNHRSRQTLRPRFFEHAKHGFRSWRNREADARNRNFRSSRGGSLAELGNRKAHVVARLGVHYLDFRR